MPGGVREALNLAPFSPSELTQPELRNANAGLGKSRASGRSILVFQKAGAGPCAPLVFHKAGTGADSFEYFEYRATRAAPARPGDSARIAAVWPGFNAGTALRSRERIVVGCSPRGEGKAYQGTTTHSQAESSRAKQRGRRAQNVARAEPPIARAEVATPRSSGAALGGRRTRVSRQPGPGGSECVPHGGHWAGRLRRPHTSTVSEAAAELALMWHPRQEAALPRPPSKLS